MANKKQKSIIRNDVLVGMLIKTILKYGGVKVTGFGTFKVKKIKARKKAFNPYTSKYQAFPAYNKVSFTPVKKFKEAIQKKQK